MLSHPLARVLQSRATAARLAARQPDFWRTGLAAAGAQPRRWQSGDASAAAAAAEESQRERIYRPMTETVRTFLNPAHFFALLRANGTTFFSGVPDSLLKDMCAFVTDNVKSENHVIASNEGTAIAMAAGHFLGTGRIPCVYLQNSGLGNTVNPILSLCAKKVYSIPVLLIVGWRGEPGKKDEPQHLVQGAVTPGMLNEMGVPHEILPDYAEGAFEVLKKAYDYMEKEQAPFALLVKKQTFESYKMKSTEIDAFGQGGLLYREEILELIAREFPTQPLLTTTGFTSREMFELRENNKESHEMDFLTVGSMGHCSSIALGVACAKPKQQVICVDGDGAAIMHLGSFATVGKCGLPNFTHVLINNAIHDSVGGQPTGAESVDFVAIARACGYSTAKSASTTDDIQAALQGMTAEGGPHFLEVRARAGAREDLGRPTTSTHENKEAFMAMLNRS